MNETPVTPQQRRNYYFIIFSVISMQITASTIYMVFPLFFTSIGLNKGESGLLISIGTFAGIISSIAAGILSNRYGRKQILFLGTLLYTVVFFIFAYSPNDFNLYMVLRFIEGFGFTVMPVMVTTMAADIFPSNERGKAMGLFSAAGGLGALIGPLLSPLLISENNYTFYFLFSGGFVTISAVAMLFLVKETLSKESMKSERNTVKGFTIDFPSFQRSVKSLGAVFGFLLLANVIYRTGLTMIEPFMSLFMREVIHIDLSQMSYIFAARAIVQIIFSPLAGILVDRSGRKVAVLLGVVMSIITLIGYSYADSFLWMVALNILNGMTWGLMMTATNTLVADLLSPEMRGFGLGLSSSIQMQSSTLGSLYSGFLIDTYGYNFVFYLAAVFCVVTFIIIQIFVPEPHRQSSLKKDERAI